MEGLIHFLLVVGFIIYILISLHEADILMPIIGVICVIGLGIYVYQKNQKQLAEDRDRQARLRQERERMMKAEIARKNDLNLIVARANQEIANIPQYLEKSEDAISQALVKRKKRAFYPFWDCIGDAVENLQEYKNAIQRLEDLRALYANSFAEYASNSENFHGIKPFPANSDAVPALRTGSETARRIDQLYEAAHSDFEFSNIYANWRTNRTLVAGFENVSNGLRAISGDLDNINLTLIDGFNNVTCAVNDSTNQIVASINDLTGTVERRSDEIASYHSKKPLEGNGGFARSEKQDEMIRLLKNIQHRREDIPTISDIGYYMVTRPKQ